MTGEEQKTAAEWKQKNEEVPRFTWTTCSVKARKGGKHAGVRGCAKEKQRGRERQERARERARERDKRERERERNKGRVQHGGAIEIGVERESANLQGTVAGGICCT